LNAFQVYRCIAAGIVNLSDFCEELIKCTFCLYSICWKTVQFWSCHNATS